MGYTLRIGNAKLNADPDTLTARYSVPPVSRSDVTRNSSGLMENECWPSYSAWGDFARRHGLHDLFFADGNSATQPWWTDDEGVEHDGLMACHPGCRRILPAHLRAFKAALASHEAKFSIDFDPSGKIGADCHPEEVDRRRLLWLVEWTEWALETCELPAFYNS